MITICTAPMPIRRCAIAGRGLVLIELIVVLVIVALLTGIAMISFGAIWGNTRFKSRADDLVNTFQMAYEAALQTDRRYAVILDRLANTYTLRQFETLDFSTMTEEESLIMTGTFDDHFQFDYVLYDDLQDTRESGEGFTEARFYAGHAGWQYGGKVVLRDRDGRPWSIVIHRIGKPVELMEGDVGFLLPQTKENVPF
jgi:Tfp pilus assembly protein PilE